MRISVVLEVMVMGPEVRSICTERNRAGGRVCDLLVNSRA